MVAAQHVAMHWGSAGSKSVLPLVQVPLAVALITSVFRPSPIRNPSFMAPDWQLCAGLNAPAALTRAWLARITDGWRWASFAFWTTVYLLLVWLLWCLVSIEIRGKGQSILTPKTRMRRIGRCS